MREVRGVRVGGLGEGETFPGAGVGAVAEDTGEADVVGVGTCGDEAEGEAAALRKVGVEELSRRLRTMGEVAGPEDDGVSGPDEGFRHQPVALLAVSLAGEVVKRILNPDGHGENYSKSTATTWVWYNTKQMKRFFYLLGLVLSGCVAVRTDLSAPATWTELGGEPVVVVRGEAVLPIVAQDTPECRRAAMFLADILEETCGKRPDVLVVSEGQRCMVEKGLFLGEVGSRSRTEELADGAEAFRVEVKDGCVRFMGRVEFAVYDWCERELGMRYYCDVGKCVEKRDEVVVRPVEYTDRPVFEKRVFGGRAAWARVAKAGDTHRGGVHVHAPHRWHRDARLKAEHPEIFETGKTPMLCYGNPATLAYYKTRIDRHIAGLEDSGGIVNPKDKIVTVCQWDAPIKCDCKWCRTLYDYAGGEAGFASPVIWENFTRKLAEWLQAAHPDYMISFLPYLNTVGVSDRSLPANCEAEVCTMPGLALLKDGETRKREESVLRGWKEATGRKIINWHYGCWPLEQTSAPYVFGRTIQRHYRDMRDVTAGSYVCGGADDPRIALSMYVWAKCLWNPDIDVEAIYDGFARRMFGPGAEPMRALIALQEDCWERQWTSDKCTYRNVFEVSYPPADAAKMKALLRKAYSQALEAGDELSARRVKWYAGGMRRFLEESEFLAQRRRDAEFKLGETREMVLARETRGTPWAKTAVKVERVEGGERVEGVEKAMEFTVRCEEPAAAKMDWTAIDDDFVWGDDCVTFVLEGMGEWRVYKTGKVESKSGVGVGQVTHDETGWTVKMSVPVTEEIAKRGYVRGNVTRWRVGDRRMPAAERVEGSRYEHSRLGTRFTQPENDPAAFVTFAL